MLRDMTTKEQNYMIIICGIHRMSVLFGLSLHRTHSSHATTESSVSYVIMCHDIKINQTDCNTKVNYKEWERWDFPNVRLNRLIIQHLWEDCSIFPQIVAGAFIYLQLQRAPGFYRTLETGFYFQFPLFDKYIWSYFRMKPPRFLIWLHFHCSNEVWLRHQHKNIHND